MKSLAFRVREELLFPSSRMLLTAVVTLSRDASSAFGIVWPQHRPTVPEMIPVIIAN